MLASLVVPVRATDRSRSSTSQIQDNGAVHTYMPCTVSPGAE